MRTVHTPIAIAVAVLCLAAAPSRSQEDPNPLAGPSVDDGAVKTLVSTAMSGEFRRVRGRPEAAAVGLLDLDDETRRKARAVIDDRDVRLAMLLIDEIDTVRRITDLNESGDRNGARRLLRELWKDFDDGARDPLAAPLAEVLPPLQLRRMNELLDEYWDAWLAWADRGRGESAGQGPRGRRTLDNLTFQVFEQEVRRSYERSLRHYREALEGIYEAVEPTRPQRERIRDHMIDHIKATRLEATPEQRRETMLEIYRMLDERRQEKLFGYLLRVAMPE